MQSRFRFTYEPDWRSAPMAYWVHLPRLDAKDECDPPAPKPVPHEGYRFLRFEFGEHELLFSAPAQLDHMIEILVKKPLPTSRQLSSVRAKGVGPNGHWLSRLPAELKEPKSRERLVRHLRALRKQILGGPKREVSPPAEWPSYPKPPRAKSAA